MLFIVFNGHVFSFFVWFPHITVWNYRDKSKKVFNQIHTVNQHAIRGNDTYDKLRSINVDIKKRYNARYNYSL